MENQNEIQISIPKPCYEDWNKMTSNEKGAFCMKCAKTVVDFTKKTAGEIRDLLTEQSGKKICGRFSINQLSDKTEKRIDLKIPLNLLPKRLSFSKAFVCAVFISFGTSLFSCSTYHGELVGEIAPADTNMVIETKAPRQVKITGDTIYNIIDPIKRQVEAPAKVGEMICTPKNDTVVKTNPGPPKEEMMLGKIKVNR